MRKAIVISIFGLIFMSITLGGIWLCIDEWAAKPLFYDILRIAACIMWADWTYKVVTLKYNWLRKLAGING
ncbi:MAG: hypothetical protein MJZ12_03865 [Prevotella sp.]|nr:hypothetical protein [Prevotella sp.]